MDTDFSIYELSTTNGHALWRRSVTAELSTATRPTSRSNARLCCSLQSGQSAFVFHVVQKLRCAPQTLSSEFQMEPPDVGGYGYNSDASLKLFSPSPVRTRISGSTC